MILDLTLPPWSGRADILQTISRSNDHTFLLTLATVYTEVAIEGLQTLNEYQLVISTGAFDSTGRYDPQLSASLLENLARAWAVLAHNSSSRTVSR